MWPAELSVFTAGVGPTPSVDGTQPEHPSYQRELAAGRKENLTRRHVVSPYPA